MVPVIIVFICIGWRILKRRKAEEKEENDFMAIRPLDVDESVKINSDDESIPYKKDLSEDSPVPTDPVKLADNMDTRVDDIDNMDTRAEDVPQPFAPYGQPYDPRQARQYNGETEIN